MLADTTNSMFKVGQMWKYQTRPGEEGSTLTVVKVESAPRIGVIVHVAVRGLHVKNPRAPDGTTTEANHLPMTESALQKSVTVMVTAHAPLPSYEEGYREWRRAFDSGRAGAFTTSVADAVPFVEATLSRPAQR
jgi:hypothetical protein